MVCHLLSRVWRLAFQDCKILRQPLNMQSACRIFRKLMTANLLCTPQSVVAALWRRVQPVFSVHCAVEKRCTGRVLTPQQKIVVSFFDTYGVLQLAPYC